MGEGFRKIVGVVCAMMFLGTILMGTVVTQIQKGVEAESCSNSAYFVKTTGSGQPAPPTGSTNPESWKQWINDMINYIVTVGGYAVPYSEFVSALGVIPPAIKVGLIGWASRQYEEAIMDSIGKSGPEIEAILKLRHITLENFQLGNYNPPGGGSGGHGSSAAGGDGADDNYDVSTPIIRQKNTFNALMRLALNKNMSNALLIKNYNATDCWSSDLWASIYENFTANEVIKIDDELHRTPDVAVLSNGYYGYFSAMLSEFDEPLDIVDVELSLFGPSLRERGILENSTFLEAHPVLLIPTGGLYGFDSSPTFKSNLEKYVSEGGTLIVFSQQRGVDYTVVPGNISAFGWREDMSCQHASAGISAYHPILAGQTSVTPNFNVDGYFTEYPQNATVLLTRTKNAQPVMLKYDYGKGKVIATTLYEDYAYGHYACGADGKQLVRDMIAWAKEPKDIPDYAPGDAVTIPIEVTNNAGSTASNVVFTIIGPDKNIVGTVEVSETVASGETKTVDFTYTAPSTYGIWWIDYTLKDSSNNIIYQMFDAARFAIAKYIENPDGFIYQGQEAVGQN